MSPMDRSDSIFQCLEKVNSRIAKPFLSLSPEHGQLFQAEIVIKIAFMFSEENHTTTHGVMRILSKEVSFGETTEEAY